MWRIAGPAKRVCDGTSRRTLLKAGGLALFEGVTLPRFLRAAAQPGAVRQGPAKSVILLNLFGGPPHLDMFDMKPHAPVEIRGEFRPIPTSLPGLDICELLPETAKRMHRASLIRTHSHPYNSHNPYNVLTGFTGGNDRENYFAKRSDHPGMGTVIQYFGMKSRDVPTYVMMPAFPGYSQALRRAGPYGGYLGAQYDPLITTCQPKFDREFDSDKEAYNPITPYGDPQPPSAEALPDVTLSRLVHRRELLAQFDDGVRRLDASRAADTMSHFQREALELLTSPRTRNAFDLSQEPAAARERYGNNLYGSCLLLSRRLVEAGVKFVGVHMESIGAGHWDNHENNFGMLRSFQLPVLDQLYSALTDDLAERGLLDSTLVVVMGEMGRSVRVNRKAGRDHWPQCGFALFTGGGVKPGCVYGTSDAQGAYPTDFPVSSGDIVATIYHLLGLDPQLTVPDLNDRPIHISHGGEPVWGIVA